MKDQSKQAIVDFFYVYDIDVSLRSLDDVFSLAMSNEYQPSGMDFDIYLALKKLLTTIRPATHPKMEHTTFWKERQ